MSYYTASVGGDVCASCGTHYRLHRINSSGYLPICPDEVALETADPVNQPDHYMLHPSGIECIEITEEMSFCVGNAIKYLWRAAHKGAALEDLRKARWYVDREIKRRGGE